MLEIKSLGTITDEAISNMNCSNGCDESVSIPLTLDDLNEQRRNEVINYIKYANEGKPGKINELSLLVWFHSPEKSISVTLFVDFDSDGDGMGEWNVTFTKREWNKFFKTILFSYFALDKNSDVITVA